jgi:hypothetical protein
VPFLKNATCLIVVPLAAAAVALSVMLDPGVNDALFAGEVMLTVGGASTVIDTALEVVGFPELSVALAVSE